MNIKIYQINISRDKDRVIFEPLDCLEKRQGSPVVNSKIYDLIFAGRVDCGSLGDVFAMFNLRHPAGFKGHSLSVSDVIEVISDATGNSTFHYCDSVGFSGVEFHPEDTQESPHLLKTETTEQLTVLLVQPGKAPKEVKIDDTLDAIQSAVGGYFEVISPFDDGAVIVCNEEGKLTGMKPNRALYEDHERSTISDILVGDFFIAYVSDSSDQLQSLPEALMKKYYERFKYPEVFIRTANGVHAIPYIRNERQWSHKDKFDHMRRTCMENNKKSPSKMRALYEKYEKIYSRAHSLGLTDSDDKISVLMDIESADRKFNLRLDDWIAADNFNFIHDFCGIRNCIVRDKFPATKFGLFVPRFARHAAPEVHD